MPTNPFPRMFALRQHFPKSSPVDIRAVLREELPKVQSRLKPGANIAVAISSRGISNLEKIVTSVLEFLKSAGAKPFIVPAMGRHVGATPEGQEKILEES